MIFPFGLGAVVAVNTIIGLPTLRQWGSSIDLGLNMLTAPALKIKFQLHYELTKLGIPIGAEFERKDFIRPGPIRAMALITNLDRQRTAITDGCNYTNQGCTVTENANKDYLCRELNVSHLV